ncbi:hypothetical protein Drorol1_Dr00005696, partial [Drosera rotundifolia]
RFRRSHSSSPTPLLLSSSICVFGGSFEARFFEERLTEVALVEGEAAMKAMELKRELSPLVKGIALEEEEDSVLDNIDRAQESLAALRSYLKAKQATVTHRSNDSHGTEEEANYCDNVVLLCIIAPVSCSGLLRLQVAPQSS